MYYGTDFPEFFEKSATSYISSALAVCLLEVEGWYIRLKRPIRPIRPTISPALRPIRPTIRPIRPTISPIRSRRLSPRG